MMDENSVQTHNQDSPDLVLLSHSDFEESIQSTAQTASSSQQTSMNNTRNRSAGFHQDYPNTPRPNSKKVTFQTKRKRCGQSCHTSTKSPNTPQHPPQNRLAFINAVKIAWLYQGKKPRRRSPDQINLIQQQQKKSNITNIPNHPPITAKNLAELSTHQLFKSIQIRHDLVMDPQLKFRPNLTKEKELQADLYWHHLDQLIQAYLKKTLTPLLFTELITMIKSLISELSAILVTLISPFPYTIPSTTTLSWHWPSQVTEFSILTVLNPDLIAAELQQGTLDFGFKFNFLDCIFQSIAPKRAHIIQALVQDMQYAKALEHVFLTLEAMKLECANCSLHYYKPYLIETSPELEWELFVRQLSHQEIELSSITEWLTATWNRLPPDADFKDVFRTGVLNLVTEDKDTVSVFSLPVVPFPITFFYDEKWLTNQMRHEFQNIIVIGLLMIPYRLIAGKSAKRSDFEKLKNTYAKILNDASFANESVSYFHLAMHASKEDAQYWSSWMDSNLRNNSEIYRIMYERVRSCLLLGDSYHAIVGLEQEIDSLRKKLERVIDHNLRTFGSLYTYLLPTVREKLTHNK